MVVYNPLKSITLIYSTIKYCFFITKKYIFKKKKVNTNYFNIKKNTYKKLMYKKVECIGTKFGRASFFGFFLL